MPKFKNIIPDGSKFCNHCGSKIESQGKTCLNPESGRTGLSPKALFCPNCGTERMVILLHLPKLSMV